MKVCVSSQGPDLESEVDQRFGRAPRFILYDTETGDYEAIDNKQNLQAQQGAGIQSAQHVVDTGAEALITGHCGPKAFRVLSSAGISVYTGAGGTVSEAIRAMQAGKLEKAAGPDVEGHW
ncbi:MAG: NifB/NifX family molybdenum-iron cluster-binding protein [bacterium]